MNAFVESLKRVGASHVADFGLPIPERLQMVLTMMVRRSPETCTRTGLLRAIRIMPALRGRNQGSQDPAAANMAISRLRKALEPEGMRIETVRGIGWRLPRKTVEALVARVERI